MQKHVKKLFLLSQLQQIVNIDTRKIFYNAHIKPHIDYASVPITVSLISVRPHSGFLFFFFSLSFSHSLLQSYSKGVFLHKVLNNNFPKYLAQLFISHQSHYTNSRNNLYVPVIPLTYLKLAYPSRERPSGTLWLKI